MCMHVIIPQHRTILLALHVKNSLQYLVENKSSESYRNAHPQQMISDTKNFNFAAAKVRCGVRVLINGIELHFHLDTTAGYCGPRSIRKMLHQLVRGHHSGRKYSKGVILHWNTVFNLEFILPKFDATAAISVIVPLL